ncbi:RCC1 domain-containing protein [Wenzhouxiangella sp. EGI_FJ10305]|uniref:RCC1 domain-containing protein n=1 Tax=Wenzhouxiangella sp. EGI_FJ10305 TaxID=3243768 RepID=UPI0035DB7364
MIRSITLAFSLGLALTLQAAPITYQGQLEDPEGPYDGSVTMRFLLFDAPDGGEPVAVHDAGTVSVVDGLFQVELEYGDVFDGRPLWLEIEVAGSVLADRQRVGATPQARFAQRDSSFCDAGGPLLGMRDDGLPLCGLAGVVDIAAGTDHACAALDDGSAWCWGVRSSGSLGDGILGSSDRVYGAVQVEVDDGGNNGGPLTGAIGVAASDDFGCALDSDGQVWCWGANSDGQLGNGSNADTTRAVAVIKGTGSPLDSAEQVSTGENHACAVDADGSVWCWGWNGRGQLGIGNTISQSRAQQVVGESAGILSGIVQVTTGREHTCAATKDGDAWCWGQGNAGQLGNGESGFDASSSIPVRIRRNEANSLTNVFNVSAFDSSTCAVVSDGGQNQGYCWGSASSGRLGNGEFSGNFVFPQQIRIADGTADGGPLDQLHSIGQAGGGGTGSGDHACAARKDGSAWCWGSGDVGQLGNGVAQPMSISRAVRVYQDRLDRFGADGGVLTRVAQVSTSMDEFSCAVDSGGRAWCWGYNPSGQLGSERGSFQDDNVYGGTHTVARAIPVLRLVEQ